MTIVIFKVSDKKNDSDYSHMIKSILLDSKALTSNLKFNLSSTNSAKQHYEQFCAQMHTKTKYENEHSIKFEKNVCAYVNMCIFFSYAPHVNECKLI